MEPCLFRHGKGTPTSPAPDKEPALQWSHVFSDMVSDADGNGMWSVTAPLQWSHVFSDMVRPASGRRTSLSALASMEPCLFRHGKGVPSARPVMVRPALQWSHVFSDMVRGAPALVVLSSTSLQWSHVFSDMVRLRSGSRIFWPERLQWSHVFSDMVSRSSARSGRRRCRFNGAMSFQTW